MEPVEEIDLKISELKWKSLPVFDRLVRDKGTIVGKKFYTKKRIKELRWFVLSCNVLLVAFALFNVYLTFSHEISAGFKVFGWLVLVSFIAQKIELSMRIGYLKEALFLKHLKKELS